MTPDLGAGLRRIRPERLVTRLTTRPRSALVAAAELPAGGRAVLVLDTNVYIRSAAGTLPTAVATLLDRGLLFHCSVALGEIAVGVANADPGWPRMRDHYRALIDRIPDTRLLNPDERIWVEAGLIAGAMTRIQRYQPLQRKDALNDALIYLTAAKAGLAVLTANRDQFDLIQQIARQGQFIHF